ncbi:hypothetical protein CDAR_543421, partial [Caerostris darwini]
MRPWYKQKYDTGIHNNLIFGKISNFNGSEEKLIATDSDDEIFQHNCFKFHQRQESIGRIIGAFAAYSKKLKALTEAREKMLNISRNQWSSSFGKFEDFSAERKKSSTNIGEFVINLDVYIQEKCSWSHRLASDFEEKNKKRYALLYQIAKKKEEIDSLKNKASSTLKIEQIEEEIEQCEESVKSTEKDLLRYIFSPPAQEDFKRFIVELIKQEKEYHLKDKEIFTNLKEIMIPKLYKEESQKSEEKKSIKKSEKSVRFADEELPPGKFYSCDVKSAQPNLSIDSPSTSSGIGLYHSDNLLPSTPTKKLFDDKMSEDIEDFNLFVA